MPDAFVWQVVTDAHLEAADDLSGWEVRSLGSGKHVLEAADWGLWLAAGEAEASRLAPIPAVLAAARDQFATLITAPSD